MQYIISMPSIVMYPYDIPKNRVYPNLIICQYTKNLKIELLFVFFIVLSIGLRT